jgi:hypothetical protein
MSEGRSGTAIDGSDASVEPPPEAGAKIAADLDAAEADAASGKPTDIDSARVAGGEVERLPLPVTAQMVVLTILVTAVHLMFLLLEPTPRWVLVLGALAVVLGTEGALRSAWPDRFRRAGEATPYVFLPALYVIATPVLIEHNVRGPWVILAGLAGGLGFGVVLLAAVGSVRPLASAYQPSRILATIATYFVAFALFSLVYVLDLDLGPAIVAVAIVAVMLGIEVLREGEVDPIETLIFAGIAGIVVGQARLLLYWFDLDTYLAGLTLLIAFFLVTGLLHAHLTRHLTRLTTAEHAGVAAAGIALVVIARGNGLA